MAFPEELEVSADEAEDLGLNDIFNRLKNEDKPSELVHNRLYGDYHEMRTGLEDFVLGEYKEGRGLRVEMAVIRRNNGRYFLKDAGHKEKFEEIDISENEPDHHTVEIEPYYLEELRAALYA